MGISYQVVKQSAPGIKGGGDYYYLSRICNRKKIGLEQMAEEIAASSSLNKLTVYHVVKALEFYMAEQLKTGYSLQLDTLGIFSVTIKGTPAGSPNEICHKNIKQTDIHFRPGKTFRKAIAEASFKQVKGDKDD